MLVAFEDMLPGETPFDISHLLIPDVGSRAQLAEIEAGQILTVLVRLFGVNPETESLPFNFEGLIDLHRQMYVGVWAWAGTFRTENLNIGVDFLQIRDRLYDLVDDVRAWDESGMDPVEQATRFHHRAVEIHPFPNGNGRWARMATNIWLQRRGLPIVQWPENRLGSESHERNDYIASLKAADLGDFDALIQMHRSYLTPVVPPPRDHRD